MDKDVHAQDIYHLQVVNVHGGDTNASDIPQMRASTCIWTQVLMQAQRTGIVTYAAFASSRAALQHVACTTYHAQGKDADKHYRGQMHKARMQSVLDQPTSFKSFLLSPAS